MKAIWNDQIIAESDDTIVVEGNHYFPSDSINKEFFKDMHQMIEKNLSESDFNVEQLGKKLYMSRATLYRKINALTGETPTEYIRTYRLKRGAELLKNNYGSVLQVALEVGFSSSAYFTKCFKKKFHQLPSEYMAANTR